MLDPGDLLASPDALLALASADYPAGTIPPYPFRVAATSGIGEPTAESNPAPGLRARVEVGDGTSTATASMPGADAPAVATMGSMTSRATTSTDGSEVTVHARTEVSGIDVLGLITIDSVVTDLTATSSGGDTTLSGGTKVVGASIFGQPVTIDADGIHPADQPPLLGGVLGPLVAGLDDLLHQAGISITLAGPVQHDGKAGELVSAGLRIGLELSPDTLPALSDLIDTLPPIENPAPGAPSVEDLLAVAQGRHLAAIEVARGGVTLQARTAAPFGGSSIPSSPSSGSIGFPSTSPSFSVPGTTGGGLPPATALPGVPTDAAALPEATGVGALVLLALLAMPFFGDRISRVCAAILATDRSTTCTREER